jgi:hypothetical protein
MRYQQPYGIADPTASYINGNPAAGIQGSIPPAAAFEQPMRELANFITLSGLTPADNDLFQLAKAAQSQAGNYAVDSGSVNAVTATFSPAVVAYNPGLPLRVKIAHNNTGATTFNGGAGIVTIKRPGGADLIANDILANGVATLVYDGTYFELNNFQAASGTGGAVNNYTIKIPFCVDTSATVNAITANFAPAITSQAEGDPIAVRIANTNTGAVTITANALAACPLNRQDGTALMAGDIIAGEIAFMFFRGTYYQLISVPWSIWNNPIKVFYARTQDTIPPGWVDTVLTHYTIQQNSLGITMTNNTKFTMPYTGWYYICDYQENDVGNGIYVIVVRTDPGGHQLDGFAIGLNGYMNETESNGGSVSTLLFCNAGDIIYTMNSTNSYNDPNYPFAVQTANRVTIMKVN